MSVGGHAGAARIAPRPSLIDSQLPHHCSSPETIVCCLAQIMPLSTCLAEQAMVLRTLPVCKCFRPDRSIIGLRRSELHRGHVIERFEPHGECHGRPSYPAGAKAPHGGSDATQGSFPPIARPLLFLFSPMRDRVYFVSQGTKAQIRTPAAQAGCPGHKARLREGPTAWTATRGASRKPSGASWRGGGPF